MLECFINNPFGLLHFSLDDKAARRVAAPENEKPASRESLLKALDTETKTSRSEI